LARWRSGEVEWTETAFATLLTGSLDEEEARTGAEPLVCLVRLECENRGVAAARAHLWLRCSQCAEPVLGADGLLEHRRPAREGRATPIVRTLARFAAQGGATGLAAVDGHRVLHHTHDLAPGERACVDVAIPYLQLLDEHERSRLRALSLPAERRSVEAFWL